MKPETEKIKSTSTTNKITTNDVVATAVPRKKGGFSLFGKVSLINIILTIRHLSVMLKSGLALEDALKVLSERAPDQKLKDTYTDMLNDVRSGKTLGESMKNQRKVFSDIMISLIDVGEQGGTLEKNLVYLADYLKKNYELQKKVKNAMLYPIIVFVLTMVEMLGVVYFLLPKLESLFNSFKNPPEFTVFVLNASKFLRDNNLAIALIIIGMVIAMILFLRTKIGRKFKDYLLLNFPIIRGLTRANILTTFSKTLAILLQSGIPISKAIEISANTIENSYYQKALRVIFEDIKAGLNLAESMSKHEKYFPATFIKIVEIGENTGTLEDNLNYLYEFYRDDLEDMSNNISTLIEPLLLIFIGIMIGFLAIIIVGPIYQLTGTINE